MHAPVLGNGVIGVTSVYYLAHAGHEVTVVDCEAGPALGTSFASASQISPGYASPWAAPGVPLKATKQMFQQHALPTIRPDGILSQLRWMWRMLRNCDAASYAQNKGRMVRLAEYNRDCIRDLRVDIGIAYEDCQQGTLQIFHTWQQSDGVANDITVLKRAGVPYELFSHEDLMRSKPGLVPTRHKLTDGLRLPNDKMSNYQLFTTRLAAMTEKLDVHFRFNSTINSPIFKNDTVRGALIDGQPVGADFMVTALDSYNMSFLKNLVNVPIYPLKRFSIIVSMADTAKSLVSTILDETYEMAATYFDDRVRVGGMAQIVGYDKHLDPNKRKMLEFVVNNLFPGAGDVSCAPFWAGLYPMMPNDTPIVGQMPVRGLQLNMDHGTLDWTMIYDSGKLLVDLMSDRPPAIRSDDPSMYRCLDGTPMPTTKPAPV